MALSDLYNPIQTGSATGRVPQRNAVDTLTQNMGGYRSRGRPMPRNAGTSLSLPRRELAEANKTKALGKLALNTYKLAKGANAAGGASGMSGGSGVTGAAGAGGAAGMAAGSGGFGAGMGSAVSVGSVAPEMAGMGVSGAAAGAGGATGGMSLLAAAGPAAAFVAAGMAVFQLMGLWDEEPYVPGVGTALAASEHGYKWNKDKQQFQKATPGEVEMIQTIVPRVWSSMMYPEEVWGRQLDPSTPGTNKLYRDVYGNKPIYVHNLPEGTEDLYEPVGFEGVQQDGVSPGVRYQLKKPSPQQVRDALMAKSLKEAEWAGLDFSGSGGTGANWWRGPEAEDAPAGEAD